MAGDDNFFSQIQRNKMLIRVDELTYIITRIAFKYWQ